MAEQTRNADTIVMNEKITARNIQLISAEGKHLGLMLRDDALRLARESGLDLVLLSEKEGEAPIAKIMDYGKASYAKKKQQVTARKKQRIIQIKEIQIGPKIGEHDFNTKMNHAVEFVADDKHVKIVLTFRGREAVNRDSKGGELFGRIDAFFEEKMKALEKPLTLVREKDVKSGTIWSRIYYGK